MSRVVVRPSVLEYGVNHAAVDEFVSALRADGFDASLDRPPERRDGEIYHAGAVIVVYLFENADNVAVVTGVAALAVKTLRKRRSARGGERRAAIFGPNGELLKEIKLDE